MSLPHTLLHAASLIHSDVGLDTRDLWPTRTRVGEDDIMVGGRSLIDLARERRTPCVLIAPGSAAGRATDGYLTMVIATVTACEEPRPWHRDAHVSVDCTLDEIASHVMHVELLSRPRSRMLMPALIHPADGGAAMRARLPQAVSPRDLVVFTCTGTISPSQITRRAAASPSSEEGEGFSGCRKYRGDPSA